MKIAVSALQPNLDGDVDTRFGRCPCFVVVDSESMEFEVFENQNVGLGGGAGVAAVQLIVNAGATGVITGVVGPNALQALTAAGIRVISGVTGNIRKALEAFKTGSLQSSPQLTVPPGMGWGCGRGGRRQKQGSGRGQGMGRGMGRKGF